MGNLNESIEFKGTKNGFLINIKGNFDINAVKSEITSKLSSNIEFFKGAKFIGINSDHLDKESTEEIINHLKDKCAIEFVDIPHRKVSHTKKEKTVAKDEKEKSISEDLPTKFVKTTIRSGSFIDYEGNIVVLGDVNPGAQLIATGNIVVMGALRGIAHAGAKGDNNAFVAANKLSPIQLRISDFIAIPPEEETSLKTEPQIAFISENIIVIESYQTRVKIME